MLIHNILSTPGTAWEEQGMPDSGIAIISCINQKRPGRSSVTSRIQFPPESHEILALHHGEVPGSAPRTAMGTAFSELSSVGPGPP